VHCEDEEGFHRTKNVRWRTVSPLQGGKKRRPSGPFDFAQGRRNDRFWALKDVGACNFGEVGPSRDNHLKQNEMRSPAMGQPRISGLEISGAVGREETLP
jgi:hypothetical protein